MSYISNCGKSRGENRETLSDTQPSINFPVSEKGLAIINREEELLQHIRSDNMKALDAVLKQADLPLYLKFPATCVAMEAVKNNNTKAVDLLLDHGGGVNCAALQMAAKNNNLSMVKSIIDHMKPFIPIESAVLVEVLSASIKKGGLTSETPDLELLCDGLPGLYYEHLAGIIKSSDQDMPHFVAEKIAELFN